MSHARAGSEPRSCDPRAAAFFGVRLLGEGELWRRVAGAALIASGVVSLALAGSGA